MWKRFLLLALLLTSFSYLSSESLTSLVDEADLLLTDLEQNLKTQQNLIDDLTKQLEIAELQQKNCEEALQEAYQQSANLENALTKSERESTIWKIVAYTTSAVAIGIGTYLIVENSK